jgi:1-aminocyclopropane-1-carboxylate deaminase
MTGRSQERLPTLQSQATPAARLPSPVEEIRDDLLSHSGVRLLLKRDDLIHPDIPGNKWRKLKYNLQAASRDGKHTLLTFGGAFSNHLRATAAAGAGLGLETVGVVRGEEHLPLNPVLAYAQRCGMRLTYLDRMTYRAKRDPAVLTALRQEFGDFYLLPEGGSNALAVRGCAEIPPEIDRAFDVICCPVGTGGTLAGVAAGLRPGQRAVGFAVLKRAQFLAAEVEDLQREALGAVTPNWSIEYGFHGGGYARSTPALRAFCAEFGERHGLRPDLIYVGKMLHGLYALIAAGRFAAGTRIVALITGPSA